MSSFFVSRRSSYGSHPSAHIAFGPNKIRWKRSCYASRQKQWKEINKIHVPHDKSIFILFYSNKKNT